jgi:hypothetical protein
MIANGGPSIYDEAKLDKYVKPVTKKFTSDNEYALLYYFSSDACRTAIATTRSADVTRPVLMRTYLLPSSSGRGKFKVWEASR